MRLQEKYNRATIAIVILVLFIAGIGYYFLIHQALIDELDEALKVEEQEISHLIRTTGTLPEESEFRDQKIQFEKASGPVVRKFISTKAYNEKEQETVILRQLIFPVTVHSGIYKVIVTKSQREVEDLLILILLITASIILLLLILLFFANRILLKKLWKPFFSTLSVINDFHLSKPINKNLPATDIDEFSALNDAWQRVTKKITTDYETVKSFADNASHEMQTPLAIINSKLDLLIQGHALNGDNVQHLQSMYDAVNKLTRLNQTLLLLTKIENDQYVEREAVNINDILSQRLDDMEELILTKKIKVTTDLRESVTTINPQLADMLVSNLLLNAIRHNIENGMINIICNRAGFQISNTGNTGSLNELIIFNRFQKDSKSAGVGLGLALVRQICETHHYTIEYRFEQHMHIFEVSF